MAHDRTVAGMRCSQVLEGLSDYVDGDLPEELRTQVEAHLAGCDWCERFGGTFINGLDALRQEPAELDESAPTGARFDELFAGVIATIGDAESSA